MTVEELIARLQPIAAVAPQTVVLIGRGDDTWYDAIEDVGTCHINRNHDGVDCAPHKPGEEEGEEVVVIH
ncbi:MAG: hypothetical protein EOP88_28230 [Verrucomicrobiaceae bacterium]|nr:MAG: hypothetical protein EOP88_28230 [Verrucomicrobiaceae bacterium]